MRPLSDRADWGRPVVPACACFSADLLNAAIRHLAPALKQASGRGDVVLLRAQSVMLLRAQSVMPGVCKGNG